MTYIKELEDARDRNVAPAGGHVKFSRQCRDAATYLSISDRFHDFHGSYVPVGKYRAILPRWVISVIEVEKEKPTLATEFDGETELRGGGVLDAEKGHRELAGTRDDKLVAGRCEEATEVETHHQQTAATTMGVAEDETPSSLTSHPNPNVNNSNQEGTCQNCDVLLLR
ncbi:hypothetical protein K0M31_017038 [Melipona bicolor]|uniref:Uncharacterized protein n=1 Tax=Melipona bicolor TaxID=60889 RepID=A0AA40FEE0_9HYME|nr:hypothetical protein K0M31_017038 [Melipona bicolor]